MAYQTLNPATGEVLQVFDTWGDEQLEIALSQVAEASPGWQQTKLAERCSLLLRVAEVLREQKEEMARLISLEMGKLIDESRAEVEKSALGCEYYAEQAGQFLADEVIGTDAGKSLVAYQPLGTVLAIMPWNFPLWQVFRFVAPALAAGNTGLLKHASNVPQCALTVERILKQAGLPDGVFRTLMIDAKDVAKVIADPRVHAVTLTGSELAGRKVAACAGEHLKKTVLELGGSDAFVILADADLELTVEQAVSSRYLNAGQSCIAAKRFIVVDEIADEFVSRFTKAVEALKPGNPMDTQTTLAPLARTDLREELHKQVESSVKAGAKVLTGGNPINTPGAFYQATILDYVTAGMPAYDEEMFGPVAAVIRARDESHALAIANDSRFGLGGSVWTRDSEKGEQFARQMQCGSTFVNGMVKSDPRLPFGGIKASGYGRELSHHGLREFVNAKTVWVK